ncbi:hypothetical protein [Streptomyces sp. SID8352]|uniref:hypothetical protein n=1 Tax=Streptomyces sp. SID8352 TaxID=2690338 RepID=UPI0013681752|nr:hypothetical protein [Streptomyces sp. SID8352]MYU24624.1 hypothetical protein [Streptomyces sp. SID8352]
MTTPAQPENAPAAPGNQPANPPAPEGTPAPTPPEPTATPATPEPTEPTTPEPKAKAPTFTGEFDPTKFEKLVENIRGDVAAEKAKREAAEKKSQKEQAAFMKRVATAFGIETDEQKPPTLEELAQQLEESRGETKASRDETRQTRVELAVYKSAARHGADPDALLDSRTFAEAVAKLDPTAGDFNTLVENAITSATDANPKLKAKAPEPKEPQPTPAGGAPMDGAPSSKRQLGAADLARMTPKQITQAVREGRLNAYLGSG